MSTPDIRVFATVGELQEAAARYVASLLAATSSGSDVRIALSGGSTPRRMHQLLAEMPAIDWSRVHIYFGDERTVGPDDEQSNYRMARETLLNSVPIPPAQVHRMRGEESSVEAAESYEIELVDTFELRYAEMPRFDLVILGMGADGHTASLFPGTAALDERLAMVVANEVPQLDTTRITLTYPVLNAARAVLFLVAGADKAGAIGRVFGPNEENRPPAAFVRPSNGELVWMLDAAAAVGLPDSR